MPLNDADQGGTIKGQHENNILHRLRNNERHDRLLLAEGYRVTIRYSEVIIDNTQAYEITYAPDGETNTVK
jgi:hypothetical protein